MREPLTGVWLALASLVCCRMAQATETALNMQTLAADHLKKWSSYSPWVFFLVFLQCGFMCCMAFYAWVLYCVWRRMVDNHSSTTYFLTPRASSVPESSIAGPSFSTLSTTDMSPCVAEEGKTECMKDRRPMRHVPHLGIVCDASPTRRSSSDGYGMGRLLGSCGCNKPGLLSLGHGKLYSALTGIYSVVDSPGSEDDTQFFL